MFDDTINHQQLEIDKFVWLTGSQLITTLAEHKD
jgi:hypothetical protein